MLWRESVEMDVSKRTVTIEITQEERQKKRGQMNTTEEVNNLCSQNDLRNKEINKTHFLMKSLSPH